jgi:hypothetical protein
MAYHQEQERAVSLKVLTKTGYSNNQWADFLCEHLPDYLRPDLVCPDTEDAASSSYFRKHSLRCRKHKPKKIATGVSQIRGLLWDPKIQAERFIVLVDQSDPDILDMGVHVHQFMHWKHKRTPTGEWDTNSFEDGGDHTQDPCRYILDLFIKSKGKAQVAVDTTTIQRQNLDASATEQIPPEVMRVYAENGAPNAFSVADRVDAVRKSNYAHLIEDTMPGEATVASKKSGKARFFY